jgi:hypothetical protein
LLQDLQEQTKAILAKAAWRECNGHGRGSPAASSEPDSLDKSRRSQGMRPTKQDSDAAFIADGVDSTTHSVAEKSEATDMSPSSTHRDVSSVSNLSRILTNNNESLMQRICNLTLVEIAEFAEAQKLETQSLPWMVWMVHRVSLDDPCLTDLDFRNCSLPPLTDPEPRILPKMFRALATNKHLRVLTLTSSNFQGATQVRELAKSLIVNKTLEVLNIECNFLTSSDLQILFESIAFNIGLKELRCSNQFGDELNDGKLFAAVDDALKVNQTLVKLGLDLTDRHYRDQITRALIRNMETARRRRQDQKLLERHRKEQEARIGGA